MTGRRVFSPLAGIALVGILLATTIPAGSLAREGPTPVPTEPAAGATRLRDSDGMTMVYVPAGEFLMGSSDAQVEKATQDCKTVYPDCSRDFFTPEQPQHRVTLDAVWIDRTEVTNAQYKACVDAGACRASGCADKSSFNGAAQPVVCIDWEQAKGYCRWAGGRLPTEAEWEKAARGTDARTYPWGNTFDGSRLNYCDKNCELNWKDVGGDDGYARTAPVGSYPAGASPYGALDMAGNVAEWVADWYDAGYYARSPERNPPGPDSGQLRVVRGGSWYGDRFDVRSAMRSVHAPTNTYNGVGFRCGVSASSSP